MRHFLCSSAVLMLIALSATHADARRTVVDGSGSVHLTGYCDLDRLDCAAKPLGFNVTLGGVTYNSFVVYGDGAITLGDTAVSTATFLNATALSDFGVPVISSGIDNSLDEIYSSGTALQQDGYIIQNNADHEIKGIFEVYLGSSEFKEESEIDITAYADRLDVKLYSFVNGDGAYIFSEPDPTPYTTVDPQLAGYYIPKGGDEEQTIDAANGFLEYSIPAVVTFGSNSAVPEPSIWMMLSVGLGMLGFALRARRSSRLVAAV